MKCWKFLFDILGEIQKPTSLPNFMPTVPRDEIWKATYQTMYDSGYNEIFAEKIMERWQVFDDLTKILVAITTASSSTAAGLAIWGLPVFKQVWIGLAAAGFILALASAALRAPDRLKAWSNSKSEFGALYIELETFMFRMKINPEFSVSEYSKEFEDYRARYGSAKHRIPDDWFATDKLGNLSQSDLNERIKTSTLAL